MDEGDPRALPRFLARPRGRVYVLRRGDRQTAGELGAFARRAAPQRHAPRHPAARTWRSAPRRRASAPTGRAARRPPPGAAWRAARTARRGSKLLTDRPPACTTCTSGWSSVGTPSRRARRHRSMSSKKRKSRASNGPSRLSRTVGAATHAAIAHPTVRARSDRKGSIRILRSGGRSAGGNGAAASGADGSRERMGGALDPAVGLEQARHQQGLALMGAARKSLEPRVAHHDVRVQQDGDGGRDQLQARGYSPRRSPHWSRVSRRAALACRPPAARGQSRCPRPPRRAADRGTDPATPAARPGRPPSCG